MKTEKHRITLQRLGQSQLNEIPKLVKDGELWDEFIHCISYGGLN